MSDANPTAVSVPNLDDIAAAAIDALVAIVRDPTSPKPLALRAATALLRYVHNERRRADARERERRKQAKQEESRESGRDSISESQNEPQFRSRVSVPRSPESRGSSSDAGEAHRRAAPQCCPSIPPGR